MLVATALVVLMMLMFAQVFQTASGLVSNQKGMAELDQSVRTMTILLRGDIEQRTFRDVVPFRPSDDVDDMEDRQGFFSISENDPNSPTDDVLHLTITINNANPEGNNPVLPFSGKAALIRRPEGEMPPGPPYSDSMIPDLDSPQDRDWYLNGRGGMSPLPANNNQPEFDDGQRSINNTGSSSHAEVVWFLRNGVLYRRLLLIRNPYVANGSDQPQDGSSTPQAMIVTNYSTQNLPWDAMNAQNNSWQDAVGRFWYDFDYSAFTTPPANGGTGLSFHSVESSMKNTNPGTPINLFYSQPAPNPPIGFPIPRSLGVPCLRYGNSPQRALEVITTGIRFSRIRKSAETP
jgi:hypothetical protein